jgi:hypothetical protein
MKLGRCYENRKAFAVVYPTGHHRGDETEVEFAEEQFFQTYEEAQEFMNSLDRDHFLDLWIVQVSGFGGLKVT